MKTQSLFMLLTNTLKLLIKLQLSNMYFKLVLVLHMNIFTFIWLLENSVD